MNRIRWGILPYALFIGAGFVIGISPTVISGVRGWREMIRDPWLLESLGFSLWIAFSSAFFSSVLGCLLGLALWRLPKRFALKSKMYMIPIIFPHLAIAFLIAMFFAPEGLLSSLFSNLGLNGRGVFESIFFGGRGVPIIIGYVYKETPFVALWVLAAAGTISPRQIETAKHLGAGQWQTFREVVFPVVAPSLGASVIIVLLYAFGALELPWVLGESRPVAISVQVYNDLYHRGLIPLDKAHSMLLVVSSISILGLIAYARLRPRGPDQTEVIP